MRAKMRVTSIVPNGNVETLNMCAVAKSELYPDDGSDENNTYAKFTPSASLSMDIANPDLVGTFKADQVFYVDFTEVNEE